jgi:hypothetical protein
VEDAEEVVLVGEPLEVGAGVGDRGELSAALEEVRRVRARLERRADFDAARKSVRSGSILDSSARIAFG